MPTRDAKGGLQLNLEGLKPGEDRPSIAITLLGDDAKPIHVATSAADGTIDIPAAALKKARRVVVGPAADDPSSSRPRDAPPVPACRLLEGHRQRRTQHRQRRLAEVAGFLRCVTGSVQLCRRSPLVVRGDLPARDGADPDPDQANPGPPVPDPPPDFRELQRVASLSPASRSAASLQSAGLSSAISVKPGLTRIPAASSISELIAWPFRCQTICNGTVEVWRRTCCCEPWIIDDPRIPNLKNELREIVEGLRHVPPWPPDPPVGPIGPIPPVGDKNPPIPPNPNPPDPAPLTDSAAIFKSGALDEKALNAATDLAAIHSLPSGPCRRVHQRPLAISGAGAGRAGRPSQVASGEINPDGRFSICWFDWPHIPPFPCSEEYAYVVKQRFPPFNITVYDGVAANIWFAPGADATLRSYSWWAYACRDNGEPGTGAFVFLDLIGDTESWNLKTPNSTAWNSVGAPAFNDGLLFPATAAAALGQNKNRNLGGTLKLSYMFSEDMQTAPVNAKYYRIGITPATPADMSGAPTAAPKYLTAGLSWKKATATDIVPVVLGPFSVGARTTCT